MLIFPTIEILGGKVVSLSRGDTDQPMIWHLDPVEKAREFAAAGASWMHLTDLDAIAGLDVNRDLKIDLIRRAGIPVQLGGGFRSMLQVDEWIDLGAGRIVLGTLAALEPDLVKKIAKKYPDQIVVSVDVWKGMVMTHGWKEPSAIAPIDFVKAYLRTPLAAILVTDIDANVDYKERTANLLETLAEISTSPIIASGVVRSNEDINWLSHLSNVSSAAVGTALFRKTADLEGILSLASTVERQRS